MLTGIGDHSFDSQRLIHYWLDFHRRVCAIAYITGKMASQFAARSGLYNFYNDNFH